MSARQPLRSLPVGLLALGGCAAPSFGAPDPASDQASQIRSLWSGTVIAALVIGAMVWSLIIWSLLRYRRRSDDVPDQSPHNIPVEVVYTLIPVVIVAVLFFFTMRTEREVTALSSRPDVRVDVVGFQWQWQFRYPGEDVTVTGESAGDPPVLVLPVDSTVRLKLIAQDVNHSFWVPRFLSKRDLIPGVRNEIDVDTTTTGSFVGRCAEFCGLDHWRMNFAVRVVSPSEYAQWLTAQKRAGDRGP